MRTGTRWTMRVKLPVALSGGSKRELGAAGRRKTVEPAFGTACPGTASIDDVDGGTDAHAFQLRFLEIRDDPQDR